MMETKSQKNQEKNKTSNPFDEEDKKPQENNIKGQKEPKKTIPENYIKKSNQDIKSLSKTKNPFEDEEETKILPKETPKTQVETKKKPK